MARVTDAVRRSLLVHLLRGNHTPVEAVAVAFRRSRQAVLRQMQLLVERGLVSRSGARRGVRYDLLPLESAAQTYVISSALEEDAVWADLIRPLCASLSPEERDICQYATTELVNNALDHSGGASVFVRGVRTGISIELQVADDGVGVFKRIATATHRPTPAEAVIDLTKGKFTTDPARHTGEGLFFTSRMFDEFSLTANGLRLSRSTARPEPRVDENVASDFATDIRCVLILPTERRMAEVFAEYSGGPDDYRFAKTEIPIKLAQFGQESLMSRSAARRVLSRIESFDEVALDFAGVRQIGQAFADEIYRVFATAHPNIRLQTLNASDAVEAMVRRARARAPQS